MLEQHLRSVRGIDGLSTVFESLGYRAEHRPFGDDAWVVAEWKGFEIIACEAIDARAAAHGLAGQLGGISPRAMAAAVSTTDLVLAAPRTGARRNSPVLVVPLQEPSPDVLDILSSLRPRSQSTGLAHTLRIRELLATEIVTGRFFTAFRTVLDRMAESLTGGTPADRHLAGLLALIRVLFLYFVQAKGWLDGRSDYLRVLLDDALARGSDFHRSVLDPLVFDTLNRPVGRRAGRHFGRIPYLNGGLFDRHPSERRLGSVAFSNELWRDAFDLLFERFRFCVHEAKEVGAIAPDMLGRVFERVMATSARHRTGTFYTPESIVRRVVVAAIESALCANGALADTVVADVVRARPIEPAQRRSARRELHGLRILDPAVGSGAFLLGALESLTEMHVGLRSASATSGRWKLLLRQRILRANLFGVDVNPVAVRLAELRLWLALVADDPTTDIERVEPLPNLDGVVRQGDSLLDPIAAAWRLGCGPAHSTRTQSEAVRAARARVFLARGAAQRPAIGALRALERTIATEMLAEAGRHTARAMRELSSVARGANLFGERSGLSRRQRKEYERLRRHRSTLRHAARALRDDTIPFFSFEVHAPDVIRRGGFTIVIGNPPWVRAERLDRRFRRLLRDRFAWWTSDSPQRGYGHQPDLAVAFLERAFELASPRGSVAMLLPSKIASAGYAQVARNHLVRETTIEYVHRIPDDEAASFGATTYPLALVATKRRAAESHRVRLRFEAEGEIRQRRLGERGPWLLAPDHVSDALDALQRSGRPLEHIARPALGVKTGANHIFVGVVLETSDEYTVLRLGSERVVLEAEIVRPVLRGRDVFAHRARPSLALVWPHHADGRVRSALPSHANEYFNRHRLRLERRADYVRPPFWTLFRLRAATGAHRIVWPDIARAPRAVALDCTEWSSAVPLNSCYVAAAPSRDAALVIAAVLNSTWIRALVTSQADEARGGYRRVNARALSRVPFPPPGPALGPLIDLSLNAHEHADTNQDDLDDAVADALQLDPTVRAQIRAYAAHHR